MSEKDVNFIPINGEMITSKNFNDRVEFYPYIDDFNYVACYKPINTFCFKRPAEINWSALGSVSPDTARRYAYAIIAAANKADELNKGDQ